MQRTSRESIYSAYDFFFRSSTTLDKLKEFAISGRLPAFQSGRRISDERDFGHVGRSIAWKLFLVPVPPLTSTLAEPPTTLIDTLRESRARYVNLVKEEMRAPDGSYEEGLVIPGETTSLRRTTHPRQDWDKNNPLSLHDENPWQDWFKAVELRRTIAQDVERTFPDILYFRQPHVQSMLTTILYLRTLDQPDIGYRQGMHEILAPLLYALDYDSLLPESSSDASDLEAIELCDRNHIAADAWVLFGAIMDRAGTWFEWQEPPLPQSMNGPMPNKAWVAPIVHVCNGILEELRMVDPALWMKMVEVNIEPQIYGIRWLRLLFSREFDMSEVMPLWDAMFAADPTLDIAKWICVAMLMRIRNRLLTADYSGQLTTLLRYPAETPINDVESPHTTVLVRQALTLQASPNPSTGVSIVMENRNLLGIPMEMSEPNSPPRRRRPQSHVVKPAPPMNGFALRDPGGLQDMIASRLQDANSALMSTVSELRRNLPELPASIIRSPMSPNEATAFPYQHVVHGAEDLSPPEPRRSRFTIERELSDVRANQKKLGEALDWSLHVLQSSIGPPNTLQQEAIECIAYVREQLGRGSGGRLDEVRLLYWGVAPDVESPSSVTSSIHSPSTHGRDLSRASQPDTRDPDEKSAKGDSSQPSIPNRGPHPPSHPPRAMFDSPFNIPSPVHRPSASALSGTGSGHRPSYSTSTLPSSFSSITRPVPPSSRSSAFSRAGSTIATADRRLSPHTPPLRGTLNNYRSIPAEYPPSAGALASPASPPSNAAKLTDPLGALK